MRGQRSKVHELIALAGPPLANGPPVLPPACHALDAHLASKLRALLGVRNGFYAFESALHVLPGSNAGPTMTLAKWNSPSGWRQAYGDLADGCFFFAEDAFGGQFCITPGSIDVFDPETGRREPLAASIEDWAAKVLDDFDFLTGHSLVHAWQVEHGPVPPGSRLIPKQPFILGGGYTLENLYALDASEGMAFRGELARQTRDLADGAKVRLKVVD